MIGFIIFFLSLKSPLNFRAALKKNLKKGIKSPNDWCSFRSNLLNTKVILSPQKVAIK